MYRTALDGRLKLLRFAAGIALLLARKPTPSWQWPAGQAPAARPLNMQSKQMCQSVRPAASANQTSTLYAHPCPDVLVF